jgi:hypothetical protein
MSCGYEFWDLIIKAGGAAAIAVSGVWAIIQYRATKEREFRRPLWEKQVQLYFEACDAAATIATTKDEGVRLKAEENFWRLYWGGLAVVEDLENVETAMVDFGNEIKKQKELTSLQSKSIQLAHSCRESLSTTWKIKFENLKGRYNKRITGTIGDAKLSSTDGTANPKLGL